MSVSLNALRGGKRKYTHTKTNSWKQMVSPCNHLSAVKTFCAHPHPSAPTYIDKAVYFSKINHTVTLTCSGAVTLTTNKSTVALSDTYNFEVATSPNTKRTFSRHPFSVRNAEELLHTKEDKEDTELKEGNTALCSLKSWTQNSASLQHSHG